MVTASVPVAVLAVLTISCGYPQPTTPTPVAPATPAAPLPTFTITGLVTATNGQQPLGGATVTIDAVSTPADGSGRYSLTQPLSLVQTLRLTIAGAGVVTRQSSLDATSRTVNIDAISTSGGFDLDFYRQFVRNTRDAPWMMEPLRRWTRAPLIYLKTIDEAGGPIDPAQLDSTSATLQDAAFYWSGGQVSNARARGRDHMRNRREFQCRTKYLRITSFLLYTASGIAVLSGPAEQYLA